MAYAVVPRKWGRARMISRYWSPVYWDDAAAVMMPNVQANMAFIGQHNELLTFPALFGIGLTRENLPVVMAALQKKIAADPDSSVAEYELGMCYYIEKQYDTAVKHLIVALGNDPSLASGWNSLGDIVRITQSEDITQVLLAALSQDPMSAEAATSISKGKGPARTFLLEIYLYSQAVTYDKNLAMAYLRLGNLFLEHNDIARGLSSLQAAQQADTRSPQLDAIRPGLRKELDQRIVDYREGFARSVAASKSGVGIGSSGAAIGNSASATESTPPAAGK